MDRTSAECTVSHHPHHRTALLAVALLGAVTACGSGTPAAPKAEEKPSRTAPSRSGATKGFTLVATGDLLVHASVIRQAQADAGGDGYDFQRMIRAAAPVVAQADLAICHMETVYGAAHGPFTGYPTFKTPPQLASAVKTLGYDSCSTASNHTLDAGPEGWSALSTPWTRPGSSTPDRPVRPRRAPVPR
ncbi:hypothetical protein SSPO_014100 [Streptomyces antimycoticus]|uniref:Capsule synthesis protein CapA domain-containing protein n=1 Tax=Streptomyces antimycoticus TaxID=68175 RepID=A0A499UEB8_9ACTN|nr:hypothetical protein SSPO_014100 [Streptomyces antimycoticus]